MYYIAPFIFSAILSLSLTALTKRAALRYGKIAKPCEDRWHSSTTALFGGVAIYFTFLIATPIFVTHLTNKFLGIIAGGTILFVIGIVDDLKPVKPYTKLLVQITAAIVAVIFGVKIEMFTPVIALPLTVLWIVAITNAFNLLDNMDGLSAGIAFITAVILSIVSAMQGRDRKSVVEGKSVDLGGRRIIKKKKTEEHTSEPHAHLTIYRIHVVEHHLLLHGSLLP